MSLLYLHIGSHKTGTSALQTSFSANAAKLAKDGVYYPASPSNSDARRGRITSGNGLRIAKWLNPALPMGFQNDNFLPHIDRAIANAAGGTILYSSEFLESFQSERLDELARYAIERSYRIKIVYYVRSVAGHALSTYSQAIKRNALTTPFLEYITHQYHNPFSDTIAGAVNAVGRDNITVLNYDALRTNLLPHFLGTILNIDPSGYPEPPIVNRSLTGFELEFMRHLNVQLRDPRLSTRISDALIYAAPTERAQFVISPDEKQHLHEKYDKDIGIVNEYVGGGPILVCDPSIREGERPEIPLGNFERAVLSVLAELAADKMDTESR